MRLIQNYSMTMELHYIPETGSQNSSKYVYDFTELDIRAGKWLRKNLGFFRFLKKNLKNLKSLGFRFFRFFFIFWSNFIKTILNFIF